MGGGGQYGNKQYEDHQKGYSQRNNNGGAYAGADHDVRLQDRDVMQMMGHPLMDLPLGGAIVPKEEIKRAALLKIEVNFKFVNFNLGN